MHGTWSRSAPRRPFSSPDDCGRPHGEVTADDEGALLVTGLDPVQVSAAAAACGAALQELSRQRVSLETAFMQLTEDSVEYRADSLPPA